MTQRGQAVPRGGSGGDTVPLLIVIPGFIFPANDITGAWLRMTRETDFVGGEVHITAKVAATGSDLIFDLLSSSDDGATFTTLFTGTKPTLAVGEQVITLTPAWDRSIVDGDLLRVDIVQGDSNYVAYGVSIDIVPS